MSAVTIINKVLKSSRALTVLSLAICFFTVNTLMFFESDPRPHYIFLYPLMLIVIAAVAVEYCRNRGGLHIEGLSVTAKISTVLWVITVVMLVVSEFRTREFYDGPAFLFLIPALCFLLIPRIPRGVHLMASAILLASLPFWAAAFAFALIGHQFTSNTIALIILSGVCGLFLMLPRISERYGFRYYPLIQLFLLSVIYTMIRIHSRTSLLSLLILFLGLQIYFYRHRQAIRPIWRRITAAVIAVLIILVIIAWINGNLNDYWLAKDAYDFSSRRIYIWRKTLAESEWLGMGYSFYFNYYLVGPHNMYVAALAYAGKLGLISFILWTGFVMIQMFSEPYALIPGETARRSSFYRVFFLVFIIGGLTEGYLFFPFYRPINLLWFCVIGDYLSRFRTPRNAASMSPTAAPVSATRYRKATVSLTLLTAALSIAALAVNLTR